MNSSDYAEYLKKINFFYKVGDGSRINKHAVFTDPKYVSIGNNTCLSACHLIGHEGAVAVFEKARGKTLDKVGKIVIGNNCFIGYGAIILPNVIIGDNCIVAAGAVVTTNIPEGSIYGGVPAKHIGDTKAYIDRIEKETKEYPWYNILKERKKIFDEETESKLLAKRLEYFFGKAEE